MHALPRLAYFRNEMQKIHLQSSESEDNHQRNLLFARQKKSSEDEKWENKNHKI